MRNHAPAQALALLASVPRDATVAARLQVRPDTHAGVIVTRPQARTATTQYGCELVRRRQLRLRAAKQRLLAQCELLGVAAGMTAEPDVVRVQGCAGVLLGLLQHEDVRRAAFEMTSVPAPPLLHVVCLWHHSPDAGLALAKDVARHALAPVVLATLVNEARLDGDSLRSAHAAGVTVVPVGTRWRDQDGGDPGLHAEVRRRLQESALLDSLQALTRPPPVDEAQARVTAQALSRMPEQEPQAHQCHLAQFYGEGDDQ